MALGRERACIMYGRVYVLPAARHRSINQRRGDGDVGVVTSHVPGLPSSGRDGRRIWHDLVVISTPGHLSARRQVQQVAGLVVLPRPRLPKGCQ